MPPKKRSRCRRSNRNRQRGGIIWVPQYATEIEWGSGGCQLEFLIMAYFSMWLIFSPMADLSMVELETCFENW